MTFYLATSAETHEGHVTMAEALDHPRRFDPVRSRGSGEIGLFKSAGIPVDFVAGEPFPTQEAWLP